MLNDDLHNIDNDDDSIEYHSSRWRLATIQLIISLQMDGVKLCPDCLSSRDSHSATQTNKERRKFHPLQADNNQYDTGLIANMTE